MFEAPSRLTEQSTLNTEEEKKAVTEKGREREKTEGERELSAGVVSKKGGEGIGDRKPFVPQTRFM